MAITTRARNLRRVTAATSAIASIALVSTAASDATTLIATLHPMQMFCVVVLGAPRLLAR